MPPRKPVYQLCDNRSRLEKAIASLKSASIIIVDCEGHHLGKKGGRLSIISLHQAKSRELFLIDVVKLYDHLDPLFDLLQSTTITKIMFDGRMDFSALYFEFGVRLQNVIDLQLVDVHSRQFRGEKDEARINRLKPLLGARCITSSRELCAQAVKLSGLSACGEEHLGSSSIKKPIVDHNNWLNRPLSKEHLSYAAIDIELMELLYDDFSSKGYISLPGLRTATLRYIELWKDDQPAPGDPFKGHPLLPLEILNFHPEVITRECNGCKRHLGSASFRGKALKCRVCKLIIKTRFFQVAKKKHEK